MTMPRLRGEPTAATNRLVWVQAGGRCAFPDCRRELVLSGDEHDPAIAIGMVAHIVGASGDGPRGTAEPPGGDRSTEPNLLLLCPTHHTEVDRKPQVFTVERLIGIKRAHEAWVRERLSVGESDAEPGPLQREVLHSTLLAVDRLPEHVYIAPSRHEENEVRAHVRAPADRAIALPFIVRAGLLITFTPLAGDDHPFVDVVREPGAAECHDAGAWLADPDLGRWYVSLLNRALNKLTGRRELHLDKEHHRYYFEPVRDGHGGVQPRTATYRPMNQGTSTRNVVWRPRRRLTGEARRHWIHLAVGLRFIRVGEVQWVLAIRPELRFTTDGFLPLVPKAIGRRATSTKSRMYNYDLLGALQFWREYLADGQPHIILDFGGQTLVIDTTLRSGEIDWPGVAGDERPFENVRREDDLFTSAAYVRALETTPSDPDIELEEWELEELEALEAVDEDRGRP